MSRNNAEKYVNSLFPTKKLSVRPEDAKSGNITLQAKSDIEKVGSPNRFGCEGTTVTVLPSRGSEARKGF